jgi:hypothetical protein
VRLRRAAERGAERDRGIAIAITSPARIDTPLRRQVYAEGSASRSAMHEAVDVFTIGQLLRDRVGELTLENSLVFHSDAEGIRQITPVVVLQPAAGRLHAGENGVRNGWRLTSRAP